MIPSSGRFGWNAIGRVYWVPSGFADVHDLGSENDSPLDQSGFSQPTSLSRPWVLLPSIGMLFFYNGQFHLRGGGHVPGLFVRDVEWAKDGNAQAPRRDGQGWKGLRTLIVVCIVGATPEV
jgi:hypothetical protein